MQPHPVNLRCSKIITRRPPAASGCPPMSTEVRLSLTARRGPQGLGMGVDTSNVVAQLVQGGQCEADGLLELGDEVVAMELTAVRGQADGWCDEAGTEARTRRVRLDCHPS